MGDESGHVINLAAFRRRTRPNARMAADVSAAEEIVESLLEAMPKAHEIPPPLLEQARRFCIAQLAAALPRHLDDEAARVRLVKEVRGALLRTVPDPFLLRALADAGGVWATPGASHWPVAWLRQLSPDSAPYLDRPSDNLTDRLAAHLVSELAATRLPAGAPQSYVSHVLERIGRLLQQPATAALFGSAGPHRVVHAYRDVAVPLLSESTSGYMRLDLVVPIRSHGDGPRYDVVIVVGKPRSDRDIIALDYARQMGAIAIRLAAQSTAPSLFAADLVIPEHGREARRRPSGSL